MHKQTHKNSLHVGLGALLLSRCHHGRRRHRLTSRFGLEERRCVYVWCHRLESPLQAGPGLKPEMSALTDDSGGGGGGKGELNIQK